MRILIVTDSYPPEVRSASQLMADLAEGLSEKGNVVVVATTMPGYNLTGHDKNKNIPEEEMLNNVRVMRIETLPHHRVNYIFRGINQLLLPYFFTKKVLQRLPRAFDVVIVHSPPLPLARAAARIAKQYHAKFIANVHDIFPQNGIDLVVWWQKPLIQLFFGWMERYVYAAADHIVVPSENHAQYLAEKREVFSAKLSVIPHWVHAESFFQTSQYNFRKQWNLENKFIFFFGGVLGPSQALDMVLDVAQTFLEIPEVCFLFVGDGTDRVRLISIVQKKKLTNVLFKPFISSEEHLALLQEVDIGVVALNSKNTTPAVPAKLMGYMAAGVPVVVSVHKESDALRIVDEAQCGFIAISNNKEGVIEAFHKAYNARFSLKILGKNGLHYAKQHFSMSRCMAMWERVLGISVQK